jgi:cobalt-zinc-cadmium resistance protein CzcA
LATVVIGGVIGAMVMSLLVLRVLYLLFNGPIAGPGDHAEISESVDQMELVSSDV